MKACCSGCSLPPGASPSMVTISLPATRRSGVTHERTALPSTSTVHAPHSPSPQPCLAPVSCSAVRSVHSSVAPSSAATAAARPRPRCLALVLRAASLLLVAAQLCAALLFRQKCGREEFDQLLDHLQQG